MATKLFVGGLAWATTDDSLREFFAQVGEVVSASVIMDRASGRSKGFGFVEMATEEEAKKALELDGQELDGRAVAIKEARPQEPRSNDGRPGGDRRSFNDRPRGGGGGFRGGNDRGGFGGGRGGSNGGFRRGDR